MRLVRLHTSATSPWPQMAGGGVVPEPHGNSARETTGWPRLLFTFAIEGIFGDHVTRYHGRAPEQGAGDGCNLTCS